MNVRIYPEWFVDGPWHGEDKRKKCPHLQGIIRCAMVRPFDVREILNPEPVTEPTFDHYTYVPKWVDIFGERICVWVSEQNAGTPGLPGAEPDWVRMLGQLIMEPHRADGENVPFNIGGLAQRHRDRWDIEHEVRREVRREITELRAMIHRLEEDLRRARTERVLTQRPAPWFSNAETSLRLLDAKRPSALLEFKDDDDDHGYVAFENIVLFFDEGDGTSESPPSWVATAQGVGARDSDHKPPCTGYGTTKKAAIIALLADGLGVYARMIAIGERMK